MKAACPKVRFLLVAAMAIATTQAQVASHAPTQVKTTTASALPPAAGNMSSASMQVSDKAVAKVNGAVLTDRDLLREMLSIFPYARQHNGFPKSEEPKIRAGALKMIEFEELVYQEAERRKITVPPAKLQKAEADFRKQFSSQEEYDNYVKQEAKGSKQTVRQRIRRSLLVEVFLKTEVDAKSKVTLAEARSFYDKNPQSFAHGDSFAIQTISIMPPETASNDVKKSAKQRAEDALTKARAAKSYEEFGMLAEKLSEDDYHVNMGDHKTVEADKLPPEIVKAAKTMKVGDVSPLLQFGSFYTFFRLNAHVPAGKVEFAAVKDRLMKDLQKDKYEQLRAALDKKLRQSAKVEEL